MGILEQDEVTHPVFFDGESQAHKHVASDRVVKCACFTFGKQPVASAALPSASSPWHLLEKVVLS